MSQQLRWVFFSWLAVIGIAGQAQAQQFTQASVGTGGTQANQGGSGGMFSGDGKSIVFFSTSNNLVPSDTNNSIDIFVRDLVGNTTSRVNVATDGSERPGGTYGYTLFGFYGDTPNVSLNHDASVVAFATTAAFVANDTITTCVRFGTILNEPCADIYVRDRNTSQTTLESVATDGTPGDNDSSDPSVSADGRFVVFSSLASNLVSGDHNTVRDVFLRDRLTQTTTRVSLSSTGAELPTRSWNGRVSADGNLVVFLTEAAVVPEPDPLPCMATQLLISNTPPCGRAYLLNRATGTVKRLPIPSRVSPQNLSNGGGVKGLAMTPDGRFVAMHGNTIDQTSYSTWVVVYDTTSGRTDVAFVADQGSRSPEVSISDNGRMVAVSVSFDAAFTKPAVIVDRLTHTLLKQPDFPLLDNRPAPDRPPLKFSPDGLRVIYDEVSARLPSDTNSSDDVYIFNRDVDGDGMTDLFETQFGLNPNDPADGTLDADGDGVTNVEEYRNGTHPKGTFKRYFAEGAANAFFTARFAVFNPNAQATTVLLELLGSNSQTSTIPIQLGANGWTAVTLDDLSIQQPDNDFSTVIESDQPVVADRTMTWDKTGYGSHAETSIDSPGTTWYMAEGSTGGTFDLFYLLQNPGTMPANVTVTYLLPAPQAPIVKQYVVDPRTRKTIHVDEEDPAVQFTDVSAKVVSDRPILVERAMYFSTPSQPFAAGHEGAAVVAPTTSWFFAEGATGSFFDLFLLLANAETTDASVEVTYLLASGAPITKHYTVDPQSRKTINVDFEDQRLIDTPVSMIVESKNSVPIIAERAMWWPSPNWYEAHLSAGATTTGTKWGLAEGVVTNTAGTETETFVLIANTSATAGNADVTLFFGDGTSMTKNFLLPANSRTNVRILTEFPDAVGKGGYGTLIQSNGVPIVVERAMYTNANGQTWAAGTDALGTKLQ